MSSWLCSLIYEFVLHCVIHTGVPLVFWMPEMNVCLQKDIEKYFLFTVGVKI